MIEYNKESLLALRQYDNFNYCVLEQRSKRPLHKNWNTITQTLDDVILEHQNKGLNIGLVLGKISGVVDIDCDSKEAVAEVINIYLGRWGGTCMGVDKTVDNLCLLTQKLYHLNCWYCL